MNTHYYHFEPKPLIYQPPIPCIPETAVNIMQTMHMHMRIVYDLFKVIASQEANQRYNCTNRVKSFDRIYDGIASVCRYILGTAPCHYPFVCPFSLNPRRTSESGLSHIKIECIEMFWECKILTVGQEFYFGTQPCSNVPIAKGAIVRNDSSGYS
jgi:hypothetical protein